MSDTTFYEKQREIFRTTVRFCPAFKVPRMCPLVFVEDDFEGWYCVWEVKVKNVRK
jgi:hypothetical protein